MAKEENPGMQLHNRILVTFWAENYKYVAFFWSSGTCCLLSRAVTSEKLQKMTFLDITTVQSIFKIVNMADKLWSWHYFQLKRMMIILRAALEVAKKFLLNVEIILFCRGSGCWSRVWCHRKNSCCNLWKCKVHNDFN